MKQYDVVVLGAGPGGYVSAIRAAQLGAKTAIIEKKHIGGTCLNEGCIPTKSLIKNVEILHNIEIGKKRGIKIEGELKIDYKRAVRTKNNAVKQLVDGVEGLLKSNNIDLYAGVGCVEKGNVEKGNIVTITDTEGEVVRIKYGKLILASGSRPVLPLFEGTDLDGVLTSEEMLSIESVPERLIIIGGGVIGCEFACIFNAYGAEVTILEMLPNLVAGLDIDICANIEGILSGNGIEIKTDMQVQKITRSKDGMLNITVKASDGSEQIVSGNQVLISIGRKPNTEGIDTIGIEKTDKGFIIVNDKLETNIAGIYAIGDVTGKKQLAHVASVMGELAAENAMGAEKMMRYDIIPSCIFTIPEIASVGLSEKEAKDAGYEVLVGQFPLMACGKAVATAEQEGIFKLVADKATRKILGAHLVGKSATEIIAELAAYMKMNATIDDVTDTTHAHPTISEAIVEAARDLDSCAIHMPKK